LLAYWALNFAVIESWVFVSDILFVLPRKVGICFIPSLQHLKGVALFLLKFLIAAFGVFGGLEVGRTVGNEALLSFLFELLLGGNLHYCVFVVLEEFNFARGAKDLVHSEVLNAGPLKLAV
jgi:hypothetical protein